MLQLTEKIIRSSFVNASRKEASVMTLPPDFATREWSRLEFFGWRDPKLPLRAYVVIPITEDAVSTVVLNRGQGGASSTTQCSWCQDVSLPNPVVLYGAKRPKRSGINYSSVAALICEDFQCSRNVRTVLPMDYQGFDPEMIRRNQIAKLQEKTAAFAALLAREN